MPHRHRWLVMHFAGGQVNAGIVGGAMQAAYGTTTLHQLGGLRRLQ